MVWKEQFIVQHSAIWFAFETQNLCGTPARLMRRLHFVKAQLVMRRISSTCLVWISDD
jgi:hypothetical protein